MDTANYTGARLALLSLQWEGWLQALLGRHTSSRPTQFSPAICTVLVHAHCGPILNRGPSLLLSHRQQLSRKQGQVLAFDAAGMLGSMGIERFLVAKIAPALTKPPQLSAMGPNIAEGTLSSAGLATDSPASRLL